MPLQTHTSWRRQAGANQFALGSRVPAILKFNGTTGFPMGTFATLSNSGLGQNFPNGIAFGPDDNLYVANIVASGTAPASCNVLAFSLRTAAPTSHPFLNPCLNPFEFLIFATPIPPPSTSGSPPPSSSGSGGRLAPQVAALSAQVTALQTAAATLLPSVATLQSQVAILQANDAATQAQIAALQAQVAKLEGQITAADLVGTYTYVGIQNELVPPSLTGPAQVGAYVYTGTVTLAADGTDRAPSGRRDAI